MEYPAKDGIEVCAAFLRLAEADGVALTNQRLQCLAYIAHGVHLAATHGIPLISERPRAWDFGPVFPALYDALRPFKRGEVSLSREAGEIPVGESEARAIRGVWRSYGKRSESELSSILRLEGRPWHAQWEKEPYGEISDTALIKHYRGMIKLIQPEQDAAQNGPRP